MKLKDDDIIKIPRWRIVDMGYIHEHISDFMLPIIDLASGCYSWVMKRDYYGFEKGGNSSMARPIVISCHRVIFSNITYNLNVDIHNYIIAEWQLNWLTSNIHYMI